LIPNDPPESGGVSSLSRSPRRPSAVALDGQAREARHAERRVNDEVGARESLVHVAVVEAALVDRLRSRGIHDRLERLVVDGDEHGGVLGDVPVACHDHGQGLADVARGPHRGRVVRDGRLDPGRERPRQPRDVVTGEDPADAGQLERGGGIQRDVRMREL
jgi:hypothetical protein